MPKLIQSIITSKQNKVPVWSSPETNLYNLFFLLLLRRYSTAVIKETFLGTYALYVNALLHPLKFKV